MGKTVRVRIAVAVDENGNWNAAGYGGEAIEYVGDHEGACMAEEGLPDDKAQRHVRFAEADVPIPDFATIQGEVKP